MPFDLAEIKAKARQIVHQTFGITAEYWYKDPAAITPLRVRWHSKLTAVGDLSGDGFPVTLDTIDRVIFNMDELAEKGVKIARGGKLKITAKNYGGQVLIIDSQHPTRGPAEEIWQVGVGSLNGEQHP